MARLADLITVFEDQNWLYLELPDDDGIVTRFADSHAGVDILLRFADNGDLAISAHSISRVTAREMATVLVALPTAPDGFVWGRDPSTGEVLAEAEIVIPADDRFASGVIQAIDRHMLAIDEFRRILQLLHLAWEAIGYTPPSAGTGPIIALPVSLEQALFQFVRASDLAVARAVLLEHPDLLASAVDDKLRRMIDDQVSDAARYLVEERRRLLSLCRSAGIDAGFAIYAGEAPAGPFTDPA